MSEVATVTDLLARERTRLASLQAAAAAARSAAERATPGGLVGYDPAILSGTTRSKRVGARQRDRRFAAYDKQAAAVKALAAQVDRVAALERRLQRAKVDEAAPCDLEGLKPGWLVRDRHGWHRVMRVSAKSVSVETPWSWTDRIPKDRIIETREARQ